jgi:glycosyltransferase involved in cell wall biosynthesis
VRFSLVIATKGRPTPLRAALESAAGTLPADGELIVVDGDPERSAEEPFAELRARHAHVNARYLATDPGLTLQRNAGIDAADGDVVVFIDDDCTVQPGLFEALAQTYRDVTVAGVTGLIEEPAAPRLGSNRRLRRLLLGGGQQGTMTSFGFRRPLLDWGQARDMEYMYGPLMSARRELAADVRFDERLSAYALGEDDDFSYRLSRRGRLRFEPTAVVHHHELGRRGMDQRKIDRLHVINKSYLFHKNFPQTLRARAGFAALLGMLCVHRAINREWAGVRGLLDGIAEVRRSRG